MEAPRTRAVTGQQLRGPTVKPVVAMAGWLAPVSGASLPRWQVEAPADTQPPEPESRVA